MSLTISIAKFAIQLQIWHVADFNYKSRANEEGRYSYQLSPHAKAGTSLRTECGNQLYLVFTHLSVHRTLDRADFVCVQFNWIPSFDGMTTYLRTLDLFVLKDFNDFLNACNSSSHISCKIGLLMGHRTQQVDCPIVYHNAHVTGL